MSMRNAPAIPKEQARFKKGEKVKNSKRLFRQHHGKQLTAMPTQ